MSAVAYQRAEDHSWSQRPGNIKEQLWQQCQDFASQVNSSSVEIRSHCVDGGQETKIRSEELWDPHASPRVLHVSEGITYELRRERPIYNERESRLCGTATVDLPVYRLGGCRSAGLEPVNVCGAPEHRRYSPLHFSRNDLPREEEAWWDRVDNGAICTSCEGDMQLRERAQCLYQNLVNMRMDQRPDDEKSILQKRLQVAFELCEDELAEEIHTEVRDFANRRDLSPACGAQLPSGLAHGLGQLNYQHPLTGASAFGVVNFCQRLSQAHVSGQLLARYADGCATDLADIHRAYGSLDACTSEPLCSAWLSALISDLLSRG